MKIKTTGFLEIYNINEANMNIVFSGDSSNVLKNALNADLIFFDF